MKLNNKTYDTLKWIVLIAMPAIATFIAAVGAYFNWAPYEAVVFVINASTTLVGTLIGISTVNYNKTRYE